MVTSVAVSTQWPRGTPGLCQSYCNGPFCSVQFCESLQIYPVMFWIALSVQDILLYFSFSLATFFDIFGWNLLFSFPCQNISKVLLKQTKKQSAIVIVITLDGQIKFAMKAFFCETCSQEVQLWQTVSVTHLHQPLLTVLNFYAKCDFRKRLWWYEFSKTFSNFLELSKAHKAVICRVFGWKHKAQRAKKCARVPLEGCIYVCEVPL